jgi:hypothetical protein
LSAGFQTHTISKKGLGGLLLDNSRLRSRAAIRGVARRELLAAVAASGLARPVWAQGNRRMLRLGIASLLKPTEKIYAGLVARKESDVAS